MATRFVRVDLSAEARDYRAIAMEPGVPMLDRSNTNSKVLLRWLGRLAAEPAWNDDSVDFFVRDDAGGRLEEIVCQPATREDLEGSLQEDSAALKDRVARAKPDAPGEQALLKSVRKSLEALLDDPNRTDLDSYFFRYRDVAGRWRLVWCWGFQRSDQEPAPAVVCTDPDCNLLFVRRPKQSPKCPSCALMIAERKGQRRSPVGILSLLLLLVLLGLVGWWWAHRPQIVVTPDGLGLIEGEIANLTVDVRNAPSGGLPICIESKDSAVAEVQTDPAMGRLVLGRKAGSTRLVVHAGALEASVPVTVREGKVVSLRFEPARLVVPVDDTIRARVVATVQTEVGHADVDPNPTGQRDALIAPDWLVWEKQPSPRIAAFYPKSIELAGISPTKSDMPETLAARFHKHLASAPVEVTVPPLSLWIEPAGWAGPRPPAKMNFGEVFGPRPVKLPVGGMLNLRGTIRHASGRLVEIPPHLLEWKIESPDKTGGAVEVKNGEVVARRPDSGTVAIYAMYHGNKSNSVEIMPVAGEQVTLELKADRSLFYPGDTGRTTLRGKTGHERPLDELLDLAPDQATFKSSDEKVLKIDPKSGSYHAIAPGEATVTATHPAAKEPATLKFTVDKGQPAHGEHPKEVRILSDQGKTVRFPVGAEFDDFRVEAEYADGYTRLVTKKATITTPEKPDGAIVSVENGRLRGIRAGSTHAEGEFQGVKAKEPLGIEVAGEIDADELRVEPEKLEILRGETASLAVVGYKHGKSIGRLDGLAAVHWESIDTRIVRIDGNNLTGIALGHCVVRASLGELRSKLAEVSVVESIVGGLKVDPPSIKIRVGESIQIGSDVTVSRAGRDISDECDVTSALPGVVGYMPDANALLGVAPGVSTVTFSAGEKVAAMRVEVTPEGMPTDGQVVVEPAAVTLAPGQSVPIRVFVVAPDGGRFDATHLAKLASSNAKKVGIVSDRACAFSPGQSDVIATLPGGSGSARAHVTVNDQEITALAIDPPRLDMAPGDRARLRIFGTAASGSHELFPQPGLSVATSSGRNTARVETECAACTGAFHAVTALRPGEATIAVRWHGKLNENVPVTVSDHWRDLRIEPAAAAIRPGQGLPYIITAVQGDRRRVVGPEQGLRLSVDRPEVATVLRATSGRGAGIVRGDRPGRTTVVAQLADQQAEAVLDVTSDTVHSYPEHGIVIGGSEVDPDWYVIPDWVIVGGGEEGIVGVVPGVVPGVETRPGIEVSPHVPPVVHPGVESAEPTIAALSIQPDRVGVQLGETTPKFVVTATDSAGRSREVPAVLTSADNAVLTPEAGAANRFVGKGYGRTEVRAEYQGRQAVATVEVTGQRFVAVTVERADMGRDDFDVSVRVQGAKAGGKIEYRIYEAGKQPPDRWVAAREGGQYQEAELRSPRLAYGPKEYHLVIEARSGSSGQASQYQLWFGLAPQVKNTK